MKLEGPAVVVPGDNVDTDVLYPGPYLNETDPERIKQWLFEGLSSSLRNELKPGVILVTGMNFGCGSSREHPVIAMKAWGVSCILGKSFARIFYRNCINLGLLAVPCAEAAAAASAGVPICLDTASGQVQVGETSFRTDPIPFFILEMLSSGGLVPYGRKLATKAHKVP
jgi:3-isopropylmalate/(R)-2-methylmalate dehydratase small subunit